MEQTSRATFKAADNNASQSRTHTSAKRLATFFCAWKTVLLVIAAASPGPGYDTSTQILLNCAGSSPGSPLSLTVEHLVSKLTRWDAIYFASSSERGQLFEQEWAFSGTFARLTSGLTRVFPSLLCNSPIVCHAFAGIVTSHVAHLLAVLFLYRITYEITPSNHNRRRQVAFTAACLHILSPAGLFLSAPYGESMFAAAHFAGLLCYVLARKHDSVTGLAGIVKASMLTVLSGLFIGFSAMIRSNGLLSGCIFAWDAVSCITRLSSDLRQRNWRSVARLGGVLLGGIFIAVGYIFPQIEAYQEYCTLGNTRPWCEKAVPSIYTFVQNHYWNVGFLNYWSLSNLPLFALAAPMLVLLAVTGFEAFQHSSTARDGTQADPPFFRHIMMRFALPQLILTVLATTSFHIQIINRISSGYPGWYIMLAIALHGSEQEMAVSSRVKKTLRGKSEWVVRAAVMYAVVQGGLYASFMPPA